MNNWVLPPKQLILNPREVHVWAVQLDLFLSDVEVLAECLSVEELQQAHRFVTAQLSNNYIVAHAFLRKILALYLHCVPKEIKLLNYPQGKPYLDPLQHSQRLEFNMSHARALAFYAIALEPVGVDVEWLREDMECEDIAERFFAAAECKALCALDKSERQKAFYQCWTLKEAFIKALGHGLAYGLNNFEVSFNSKDSATNCLQSIEGSAEKAQGWNLQNLSYSKDYAAALALQGPLEGLKLYRVDSLSLAHKS